MPRKPKDENDQLAKNVGEQITHAMKRRGMTVSDLHKATGISRTVLLAYTRGNYAPGARELKLLCEHLETTPTVLLFGRNEIKSSPYKIGDIALSSQGALVVTCLVFIGQLTQREQEAVLTLIESLVEARDPQAHGQMVDVVRVLLESEAGHMLSSQLEQIVEGAMAPHTAELEAAIEERSRKRSS